MKASMNRILCLQVQDRRPAAGLAASAESSPQVSGRDLSSQTTRRNGGSTGGNGLVLFHPRSQSSLCWQHTYGKTEIQKINITIHVYLSVNLRYDESDTTLEINKTYLHKKYKHEETTMNDVTLLNREDGMLWAVLDINTLQ